jgi:hypothetical protein
MSASYEASRDLDNPQTQAALGTVSPSAGPSAEAKEFEEVLWTPVSLRTPGTHAVLLRTVGQPLIEQVSRMEGPATVVLQGRNSGFHQEAPIIDWAEFPKETIRYTSDFYSFAAYVGGLVSSVRGAIIGTDDRGNQAIYPFPVEPVGVVHLSFVDNYVDLGHAEVIFQPPVNG